MMKSTAPGLDVLHVEDDDQYAELVKYWVSGRGLNLLRVRSRAELLGFLAKCDVPPRCLLLDLTLGDSKGLTLCDELKKSPSLQQLPIVLLSGANMTACECLEHGAVQFVRKGTEGGPELLAALTSVIAQHARSRGTVDAGDLQLDPSTRSVSINGQLVATLAHGPFEALMLLVKSSPGTVSDEALYAVFLDRHAYHHRDDSDMTVRNVVRNYVSLLRRHAGEVVGGRISRLRKDGYAYRFSAGKDQFQID